MHRFINNRSGQFGIMMSILAIPLVGAMAGAVEITLINRDRTALQDALDAALLAAGRDPTEPPGQKRKIAREHLDSNLKLLNTSRARLEIEISETGTRLDGTVTARYKTSLLSIVGIRQFSVEVESAAAQGASGFLDTALVLDATGSLGNSGVNAVRRAANAFKNAVFDSASDPSYVQMAVVPFAATVNVGRGFPMAMLDRNADGRLHASYLEGKHLAFLRSTCSVDPYTGAPTSDPGPGRVESNLRGAWGDAVRFAGQALEATSLVSAAQANPFGLPQAHGLPIGFFTRGDAGCEWLVNPLKINQFDLFDAIPNVRWAGCLEARPEPFDTSDQAPLGSNADTLFVPFFWPDEPDPSESWMPVHENNYMADFNPAAMPWNPNDWAQFGYWGRGQTITKYNGAISASIGPLGEFSSGPNKGCPTPILPLTSSETQVTAAIADYDRVDGGGTLISEGVAWGMRVLSPGEPFTQTKPGEATKRVMVLMSDGENQASINPRAPNPTSGADHRGSPVVTDYTAYGYVRFGRLSPDDRISTFEAALSDKTRQACDAAKAQGIDIYTVLFNSTSAAARDALQNCATVPEMFFNARDADELENTFRAIAGDFGAYRLVK